MRPRFVFDPLKLPRSRALVAASLLAYCAAAIGFPLPQFQAKSGAPFPCQDHACGCASAEQCWKSCCCFSPEQKLAWAREHGVQPPTELIAEVDARQHDHHSHQQANPVAASKCGHAKCNHRHQIAGRNCRDGQFLARSTTVHPPAGKCCEKRTPAARSAKSKSFVFVIGSQALGCRGLSSQWCSSGAVVPPPAALGWQFDWQLVERLAPECQQSVCAELAPPVPPPRV